MCVVSGFHDRSVGCGCFYLRYKIKPFILMSMFMRLKYCNISIQIVGFLLNFLRQISTSLTFPIKMLSLLFRDQPNTLDNANDGVSLSTQKSFVAIEFDRSYIFSAFTRHYWPSSLCTILMASVYNSLSRSSLRMEPNPAQYHPQWRSLMVGWRTTSVNNNNN